MNCNCYLLIKYATRKSLIDAVGQLSAFPQVQGWDAVNGDFSLVIRVKGDAQDVLNSLKQQDQSLQTCVCHLTDPTRVKIDNGNGKAGSYVFVETQKGRQKEVAEALGKLEDTESCHFTNGACDLVAVVRADNFHVLDRLIDERIRTLDGVLRIKQNLIISLDTL